MKLKGALIFWTDVVIALLMAALIATGSILRWVLPPGSGGGGHGPGHGRGWGMGAAWKESGKSLLDLTRHQWGDVHFWIAVALLAGVGLHLALHWGWIKASIICRVPGLGRRRQRLPA